MPKEVPIHDDITKFHWPIADSKRRRRYSAITPTRSPQCSSGETITEGIGWSKEDYAIERNDRIQPSPFILTGGFPCQPFSCAGKRRGKEDVRYLWKEMLRIIGECKPTWVIAENVGGILGMVEFDSLLEMDDKKYSDDEMAAGQVGVGEMRERIGRGILDEIMEDLEKIGYSIQPFVIPACAVNAPHRRDRVWIVANLRCDGCRKGISSLPGQESGTAFPCDTDRYASNAESQNDRGYLRRTEERQIPEPGNGIEPTASPDTEGQRMEGGDTEGAGCSGKRDT